jgi:hypothetical protein
LKILIINNKELILLNNFSINHFTWGIGTPLISISKIQSSPSSICLSKSGLVIDDGPCNQALIIIDI